ncbi:hypothetical protein ABTY00_35375 [Streptomyces microflavus]|uniref:hypothetical protein n=1 Tax=Streptomyces microflavus TaxID=1919 RepID=UPI003320254D
MIRPSSSAAFERGERHVGVAVIALALHHSDSRTILPRVAQALRATRRHQGAVALAHVARLQHSLDPECLALR